MVEPLSLSAIAIKAAAPTVSVLAKVAVDFASTRLKSIKENAAANADAAIAYLEVANAAMTALEAESDQILVATKKLKRAESKEKSAASVLDAIDGLLTREVLRPLIAYSVAQLDVCRASLHDNARRFFGKRPPPQNEQDVLDFLGDAIRYCEEYLDWLHANMEPGNPSAVWYYWLKEIETDLSAGKWDHAAQVAERALNLRQPLSLERSFALGRLTEEIRTKLK